MKTLTLTDAELKRKVARAKRSYHDSRWMIYVTSDAVLGRLGEAFETKCGIFVLDKILPYIHDRENLIRSHYHNEGYHSPRLFGIDLYKKFPDSYKLFVHVFKEVFIDDTDRRSEWHRSR